MKIPCSNCNQRLEIPEELAGQTIECPACKASLTVPSLQPPPVTPQVQVTTPQAAAPQAAAPQKTAPQRKTSTALKAASSKKSKLPIPKWAIAAVGGVTVMALVMYFLSGPSVDIRTAAATGNIEAAQPEPPTAKAPDISIHKAAEEGNIEAVKKHLAAGTDVNARVTRKYTTGWTVLHFAAEHDHWEITELLIAKGADVNAKESGLGTAPLHRAAFRGHEAIVELLIAEGADVNAKIKLGGLKGQTPLDIATHPDNPNASAETADLLRKHGGKTGEELKATGN